MKYILIMLVIPVIFLLLMEGFKLLIFKIIKNQIIKDAKQFDNESHFYNYLCNKYNDGKELIKKWQ